MRKDIVFSGGVVLVAFLVNYVLLLLWIEDHIISFWSLGVLTVLLLVVGVIVPTKSLER